MESLTLVLIGIVAGVASGLFGIGGGLIIVPALILLLGMKQIQATGTSLAALIPPVGLLGAMEFYRSGNLNLRYSLLLAIGIFVGAWFGAKIAIGMSPVMLRKTYAVFLLVVGVRMLFFQK